MGLFDIFKTPVHEKYSGLIQALKEHYRSLCTTRVETSVFSMGAKHCNNLDNLCITIFRGSAYNEHPSEYKNLYYEDYVFVKTTYSINGEAITIRNAFPKDGNQFMMFMSVLGAEMAKTSYEINLQQQKEEEKKKAEEGKLQELLLQKMKEKGISIDEDKLKEEYNKLNNNSNKDYEIDTLTTIQKIGLLGTTVSLCTYTELSCTNGILETIFKFSNLLGLTKNCCNDVINRQSEEDKGRYIQEVRTIKKDGPFIQFIFVCQDIIDLLDYSTYIKEKFNKILESIGFSSEDIDAISHGRYNYRFSGNNEEKDSSSSNVKTDKITVVQTWSLIEFAKMFDSVRVGTCTNNTTGKKYPACAFTSDEKRVFALFSSKLGGLTAKEIAERKHQLKISKLSNETYVLHE